MAGGNGKEEMNNSVSVRQSRPKLASINRYGHFVNTVDYGSAS